MCRLFGFRSSLESQVHRSLISAENALIDQSRRHSDGWGVAYYIEKSPHLIKSTEAAFDDRIFRHVSGIVSSETVIAHLRLATVGQLSILNSHPFQFGRWVFAHNGNIRDFAQHRDKIQERINPRLRRFILGDTDSETIFYLLLTFIREHQAENETTGLEKLVAAIKDGIAFLTSQVGDFSHEDGDPNLTYVTFVITDGARMLAHQGGKQLYYSTHKHLCSQRETCPAYALLCEAPAATGDTVRHLILASEPLHGENIWLPLKPGSMVGVDATMRLGLF